MMRIALISSNAREREMLRKAIARCAEDLHHPPVDIASYGDVAAFHDTLVARNPLHFDVVFCCIDRLKGLDAPSPEGSTTPDIEPLDYLARLQQRIPAIHLVVASHDSAPAIEAYRLHAAFLYLPGTYDDLRNALRKPFSRKGWDSVPCLSVRTAGQVSNVAIPDIQFVESSKRGPVIHLPNNRLVVARGTLKALFECLEAGLESHLAATGREGLPSPFVMAGSSFVVNLDNVVASGQGVLVFSDGETIIVPVRKRKDIEQALLDFRSFGPDIV